jgi:hypothetical protein
VHVLGLARPARQQRHRQDDAGGAEDCSDRERPEVQIQSSPLISVKTSAIVPRVLVTARPRRQPLPDTGC